MGGSDIFGQRRLDTQNEQTPAQERGFLVCRRGDTNPKYMEPLEWGLRRRLTRNAWSQSHDRVSGSDTALEPAEPLKAPVTITRPSFRNTATPTNILNQAPTGSVPASPPRLSSTALGPLPGGPVALADVILRRRYPWLAGHNQTCDAMSPGWSDGWKCPSLADAQDSMVQSSGWP